MSETSRAPDLSGLEVPMDQWTQPFWDAADVGELKLPHCGECRRFRWPPGPFCPHCRSQAVAWAPSGPAQIYSYTVTSSRVGDESASYVPALVEFPQADGVRVLAAIVDTPLSAVRIGAELSLGWSQAASARVPVFRVADAAAEFSDEREA